MNNLIVSLIILTVSGLGFITYRHPIIAQRILKYIGLSLLGLFIIFNGYYITRILSYHEALDCINNGFNKNKIEFPNTHNYKKSLSNDSIEIAINKKVNDIDTFLKIKKNNEEIKTDIKNEIEILLENNNKIYNHFSTYFHLAFVIIIVLVILSFVFENMYINMNKNSNDKS